MHHLPDRIAQFLEMLTENERVLKLTPDHLIFASKCNDSTVDSMQEAIEARFVKVGDCLSMLASTLAGQIGTVKVPVVDIRMVGAT
jgi:hypothetical protein